jgi:hypothetical protein
MAATIDRQGKLLLFAQEPQPAEDERSKGPVALARSFV